MKQSLVFDYLIELLGENKAREIVLAVGDKSSILAFLRFADIRFARRLLAERTPRPAIRDKLVDSGKSERSAYRIIEAALQRAI